MNFRDAELLSTYLDGQLTQSEAARLEARLAGDAELRHLLDDLRSARTLLRALPRRKAPRNFTLRPQTRQLAAPLPRAVPVLRLASALAFVLFLGTFAANGLVPLARTRLAAAPAPVYGMGGGGAPAEAVTPASTESAASALAAAPTGAPEPTLPVQALQAQPAATLPPTAKARPSETVLVPAVLQAALAALAVALGVGAWYLNAAAARRFRKRLAEKKDQ